MFIKQAFENIDFGAGFNNIVTDCVVQSTGKIVLVGLFTEYNGVVVPGIVRLFPDGEIDKRFNPGTGTDGTPSLPRLSIFADDTMILSACPTYNGTISYYIEGNTVNYDSYFHKLNADGSRNNLRVSSSGFAALPALIWNAVADLTTGGIYAVNQRPLSPFQSGLVKYQSDGTGLGVNGIVGNGGECYAIKKRYSTSRIYIGGNLGDTTPTVSHLVICDSEGGHYVSQAYYPHDGAIFDTDFLNADDKAIVAGEFTKWNVSGLTPTVKYIAKIGDDTGGYDTTFNTNIGTSFNSAPRCIKVLSDDRIIVGGSFTSFNGIAKNSLVLLNGDGTIDATFNSGTGLDYSPMVIKQLSDGNILVAGDFTTYKGKKQNRIMIINTKGELIS